MNFLISLSEAANAAIRTPDWLNVVLVPVSSILAIPLIAFRTIFALSPVKHEAPKKFKVLIVDDDSSSTLLLQVALKSISDKVHIDIVEAGKDAVIDLSRKEYDLVFMDHEMPDLKGPDVVKQADAALAQRAESSTGSKKQKLTVITYSADQWQDWDADKLTYMNVQGHISKSLRFNQMQETLAQMINTPSNLLEELLS